MSTSADKQVHADGRDCQDGDRRPGTALEWLLLQSITLLLVKFDAAFQSTVPVSEPHRC